MTCQSSKLFFPPASYPTVLPLVELGVHSPSCRHHQFSLAQANVLIQSQFKELQEEFTQVDPSQAKWLMGKLAWMGQSSTCASQLFSQLMDRAGGKLAEGANGHAGIGWLILDEALDDWVSQEQTPIEKLKRGAAARIREAYTAGMKELDLGGFLLQDLPPAVQQLKQLEKVKLTWNQFKSVPPCLFKMPALREIHLDHCGISELPNDLSKWKQLRHLVLGYNQLEAIPEGVRDLQALEFLDLRENQLTGLPREMGHLWDLKQLILINNPLKSLPDELGFLSSVQVVGV